MRRQNGMGAVLAVALAVVIATLLFMSWRVLVGPPAAPLSPEEVRSATGMEAE